ncbi:S1 family peptidase [Tunturiibacter gelidiferens]|uniref:S1 family peptidase n=1 Tax=Tunturiibacter gelidiferens TaxID=3069689 RepID=UPI003D9B5C73
MNARIVVLLFFIAWTPCKAQSKTPKIVSSSPRGELRGRYESLVCGIALIQTERGSGTGFFINSKGDMITAAHVISVKSYVIQQGQLGFTLAVDKQISITPNGNTKVNIPASQVDVNADELADDLAFLHTGQKPPCWIPLGEASSTKTGDHLISIGFPGIDNFNPILYDGFLSGRFKHPPIPIGSVGNQPVFATYEVMKVQMPITPGASGSPIIDDSNHAVGVISESPVMWTRDLEQIATVTNSGVKISGYDTNAILGQLATIVHEFESPGSGYAVPLSYLSPTRAEPAPNPTSSH